MSRPAAKSRAEKSKDKPASHEIIPGKFTEHDWQWMVDRDDGEEFAAQIVDEIVGAATQVVYTRWVDQNLYPYTVHTCQEVLFQMMDWYFLDHDQGEPEIATDPLWLEDTEPEPCRRECLSEGLVPKTTIISPIIEETTVQAFSASMPHIHSEREGTDEGVQEEQRPEPEFTSEEQASAESLAAPPAPPGVSPRMPLAASFAAARALGGKRAPLPPVPRAPRRKPAPTRPLAMPATGSERGSNSERAHFEQFVRDMQALGFSPAAVAEQFIAQQQQPPFFAAQPLPQATAHKAAKAPTGDGLYDEQGNQITFPKFDPDRLPARTIKVGYQLVDPQVIAARRRLELLQKGQPLDDDEKEGGGDDGSSGAASAASGGAKSSAGASAAGASKEKKAKAGKTGGAARKTLDLPKAVAVPKLTTRSMAASTGPGDKHHVLERIDPLPPPLIETIGVSAGVTVKEGDRIKKGHPLPSNKLEKLSEEQLLTLRPVRVRGGANTATGALYTIDPTASTYASPMALPPATSTTAAGPGAQQQEVFEALIKPVQFAPLSAGFEQDAR